MRETEKAEGRGLTRRRFVVGASGLAASGVSVRFAGERALAAPQPPERVPLGGQPKGLPKRQHAWGDYVAKDAYGNALAPKYDRLLFFDVKGTPTPVHARLLESRLRTLERHFHWSHTGLLFTVSWGPSYFKLLGVRSPIPRASKLSSFEHPEIDNYDVCLHLACDDEKRLKQIEAALVHGRKLPGVDSPLSLKSALTWRETRTGFTGTGIPAAKQNVKGIPSGHPVANDAPLFMGFQSGLRKNQNTEDGVTISHGPFAGGTTMHVSYMREPLESWYRKLSQEDRIALMFSPETNAKRQQRIIEGHTDASANTKELVEAIKKYGRVGHSQATAQARKHGRPLIIRRDFNTVDGNYAGLHFVAVQKSIQDFVVTRNAMNASGAHNINQQVTDTKNNGINAFMKVRRRANYIMPSRADRSFPLLPGRAVAP
jgi:dye decolorizing peroxidase